MSECACCGAALECRRRQPATRGDGETEHYRCPDCGEGGFRVLGPNGSEVRTGGPAFDGPPDRHAEIQDVDDGILIADGGDRQLELGAYDRLTKLSDAEADVYRRVENNGTTVEEVADQTDRAETTVRTLLHRARRKLGEQPRIPS